MYKNATDSIKYNSSNILASISDERSEISNKAFGDYLRRIKLNKSYKNNNSAQILEELLF